MKIKSKEIKLSYVYVGKHKKDCSGARYVENGTWDTTWFFRGVKFGGKTNPVNPKRKNKIWLQGVCNVTDCPAKLFIYHADIATCFLPFDQPRTTEKGGEGE